MAGRNHLTLLRAPSRPVDTARAAPRRLIGRRRLWLALGTLGPGVIAANAGNDAGGIVTYASAGARFGDRTLFVMGLVTVALVVVQEMCARLGAYGGRGLGALIRAHFGLRLTALALGLLLVANTGLVVSEFAGIAAALQLLGVGRLLTVPFAALAVWGLVVFGSYRHAERIFLALGLVFVAYPAAALLAHPDWGRAADQLIVPHLLADRSFLLLSVALIGTTITPYMQFYVAAAVADRGDGPAEYARTRTDTVVGVILADLVSMFIIVATAAAVHHRAPLTSAAQAADALRPVAGRFAVTLFAIGLCGASALAAAVVPLSSAYAVGEATGTVASVSRRLREAPVFLGLFTIEIVIGAACALVPGNLISLLVDAQLLNGLITPILLGFILALANRASVLGEAANGRVLRVVATVTVAVVAAMALGAVISAL